MCATFSSCCSKPCRPCDRALTLPTFAVIMRYAPICLTTGSLLLLATTCTKTEDATPAATASRDNNLALGNPSGAVASTSSPTNYSLVKYLYMLSYNCD